jgi:hypothetical protein
MKDSAENSVGIYLKIDIMKGVLAYIWVNMGANCMMYHTSAVNSNVNIYRNAQDNLNCIIDSSHHIEQPICANCVKCRTTAVQESRQLVGCPR